jgi:hypothetical protein
VRCVLIASLSHAGRDGEARAQAAELMRRNLGFTRALTRVTHPFRYQWMADLFLDGLAKAGVPTG